MIPTDQLPRAGTLGETDLVRVTRPTLTPPNERQATLAQLAALLGGGGGGGGGSHPLTNPAAVEYFDAGGNLELTAEDHNKLFIMNTNSVGGHLLPEIAEGLRVGILNMHATTGLEFYPAEGDATLTDQAAITILARNSQAVAVVVIEALNVNGTLRWVVTAGGNYAYSDPA